MDKRIWPILRHLGRIEENLGYKLLQQLTDDIFAHLIFGDEQAADQDYLNKMFDAIDAKKNRIEKVFSIICTIFPFLKPIVHWMNSKLKTNYFFNNQLYKNIAEKIERRKKELKSQKKSTGNQNFTYLDHLLITELLDKDEEREEEKEYFYSGRQVTRYLMTNEIVSAMMNMLYAGHKTSARALIAVVYSLAKNPAVQKKVFDEEVSNLNEDLTFEMLESLTYLDLVIREALRLFPLGSEHVARKCMASTTLGGEIKLEIGNFVMVDVMSLHLNENLWGPEPEKFNPDRWLNLQYKNSTQYLSFGQGPRMCLGEKLAMLKLKIMLVVLLKNFRIIAVDEEVYLKD
uniref:Cytochrome P450 n=1 Tax=Acrobeloides nanus TaxID=290746 RepID=A0A914ELM3_9BILA